MSKELDLEIYDIVKIVEGNGSICLESINEIHNDENGKLAFTDNFVIDLKNVEVNCISDGNPYQLEMVWHLDDNRNYTMIYPIHRLESIDNANPSEALKTLEDLRKQVSFANSDGCIFNDIYEDIIRDIEIIKQALLKAQEQEKVLSIIKEKCLTNCNLALVKDNVHYENYCKEFEYFLNKYNESPNGFEITKEDLLTEEEFELLKQYFENKCK